MTKGAEMRPFPLFLSIKDIIMILRKNFYVDLVHPFFDIIKANIFFVAGIYTFIIALYTIFNFSLG